MTGDTWYDRELGKVAIDACGTVNVTTATTGGGITTTTTGGGINGISSTTTGGAYTVLVPEEVLSGLDATKITGVTADWEAAFISQIDAGMQRYDELKYACSPSTGLVSLESFFDARYIYIEEDRMQIKDEAQARLNELQKIL